MDENAMPASTLDPALDDLLARYAAGALDPALHALVEAHLELKPGSRSFVRALESFEGDALSGLPGERLDHRDACLSRIFGDAPPAAQKPATQSGELPWAVMRFLGSDLAGVRWRSKLPGVKECRVGEGRDGEASLFWIDAGRSIPSHTHDGSETTLVLRGAFADINGRYERGDIAFADSEVDHRPTVDRGGDCICFAVTEGHLHLTGPIGRIVDRFFGGR